MNFSPGTFGLEGNSNSYKSLNEGSGPLGCELFKMFESLTAY